MPLVTCIHTSTSNMFFLLALRSNAAHGLLIHEVSTSHTTIYHCR